MTSSRTSQTLAHYNATAQQYAERWHVNPNVEPTCLAFLDAVENARASSLSPEELTLPPKVLDVGCGSGRDAQLFHRHGWTVDAFDGSPAMVEEARLRTGLTIQCMTFEELTLPPERYDGIWAMASLLHAAPEDLPKVFSVLAQSLRPHGVFWATFKYGAGVREDASDGRVFTDMNEERLMALLESLPLDSGLTLEGTNEQVSTLHRSHPQWITFQLKKKPVLSPALKKRGP